MLKLTKRQINQNIVPLLSKGTRGSRCKVGEWRIYRYWQQYQLTKSNSICMIENSKEGQPK